MTLLTTPTLQSLYRRASRSDGLEHETIRFWHHLLSKVYFRAEYFVVSHENPPSSAPEERLRRVDFSIGRINIVTDELAVIAFVEGKRTKAGEGDYEEVEAQCYQACEAHLKHYEDCRHVYGICVVGTEARVFRCKRGPPLRFLSVTNSYLDADGPNASELHRHFTTMEGRAQPRTLTSSTGHLQTSGHGQFGGGSTTGSQTVPPGYYIASDGHQYPMQSSSATPTAQTTSQYQQPQQAPLNQQQTSGQGQFGGGSTTGSQTVPPGYYIGSDGR